MSRRKVIGTCKLRGEKNVQLVASHIIPRSFFHWLKSDGSKSTVIFDGLKQAEYSQSGIYEYFLCQACEGVFRVWDAHAKEILTAPLNTSDFIEKDVYQFKSANYAELKLFFLSVLWRAHHSQHQMFSSVNLGPHEPVLKELILNGDPGLAEKYSVLLERFINLPGPGRTQFGPFKSDLEQLNTYVFYLADHKVHVVVDKRTFPAEKMEIVLSKKLAPVFLIDYKTSKESKVWVDLMKQDVKRRKKV